MAGEGHRPAATRAGGPFKLLMAKVDRLRVSPAWRWMGLEVAELGEGRAVVTMPIREEMTNFQHVVHGGFISMLADSAMGRALATALPEGERHFTFDLKMNFINYAKAPEVLRGIGTVIHAGHRTGVVECRVEGEDGRLVATASASFSVYLPGPAGAENT